MTDGVYHDVELPGYFNFDEVLAFVRKKVGSRTLDECCVKGRRPEDMQSSVNLDILMNKDGKYGVRPLTIINPYLYYMLARLLCEPKNWRSLRHCFRQYEASGIQASAMPIVRAENEDFHNSTTILNWWRCVEQKSIELSLEYKYNVKDDFLQYYIDEFCYKYNRRYFYNDSPTNLKERLEVACVERVSTFKHRTYR